MDSMLSVNETETGFLSDCKKNSIIFYGAGNYAVENLERLELDGLTPVCFADSDVNKHNTKLGRYDIFPLDIAMQKFPDYVLILTLYRSSLFTVTQYLLKRGIPKERIRYVEPVEYRLECDHLCFAMFDNEFAFCCFSDLSKHHSSKGDFSTDILEWKRLYNELLTDKRNGKPTVCDGCPFLKWGIYPIEPWKIIRFVSSSNSICNFSCIYCFKEYINTNTGDVLIDNLFIQCKQLTDYYNDPELTVIIARGEPTISFKFDEAINLLSQKSKKISIATNAFIYSETISEVAKAGVNVELCVSNDAGTPETFTKIKGLDCYETVIKNLMLYAENGIHICLKYIILSGINDNEEDISGFTRLAKMLRATVVLSKNIVSGRKSDMTDSERFWLKKLAVKCKEHKVNYYISKTCVSDNDRNHLEKYIGEFYI